MNNNPRMQLKFFGLFILVMFVLIPIFLIFLSLSLIFTNKDINYDQNNLSNIESAQNIINNINEKGVSSLYDLLVKYNYPCFTK
jgi:hypothetical protein